MKPVSEIQVNVIKPKNGLIGFASLILYECMYLGSIGIYRKLDGSGYRITYPNKTVGDKCLDIYHPINRDISTEIEKAIIDKAEELFES